ncbi:MAG: type VI secretion system baseplate subunit TssK [Succinivibrio sp.]|nr:type VI secretion system baseplate subunit TssK [Succinivibrio sp.]
MHFDEQVHWSEGLFLQPHHLQRMSMNLRKQIRSSRMLSRPFCYGFNDLDLDLEALKSRRVVLKRFSAVLPDGVELSMPENCEVPPLTFSAADQTEETITVYLSVPLWSPSFPNVSEQGGGTRYVLREIMVADENTSDNGIPMIMRRYGVNLTTDEHQARNCTLMPLCRLRWDAVNASAPALSLDKTFMPPFIWVSAQCPLLPLVTELIFQLKSCRSNILTELESGNYDPKLLSGVTIVDLLRFETLNKYIYRLSNLLVPERITPFELYMELLSLLGELEVANPLRRTESLKPYDHDDALPLFDELLLRIRALILQGGASSALSFEFAPGEHSYLELSSEDERLFNASEMYLALEFKGDSKARITDVEVGDNFRLIDERSFSDRVRGIKLSELRYPPQFLPNLPGTVWFKVLKEQTPRIWRYIMDDHKMIIDYAQDQFPSLQATMYVKLKEQSEQ